MKWFWLAGLVLILDQSSKWIADNLLGPHDAVPLLPFLALRKAYNPGAAFSFLSDASGWQRWFFVGLAALVIGVLVAWLRRLPKEQGRMALALALILGGAAGNLVDRLLYGHVIDFIDLYYGGWHWPTFNIADSAITLGAALLLLDAFTGRQEEAPGRQ
jgi:signal peptidase II